MKNVNLAVSLFVALTALLWGCNSDESLFPQQTQPPVSDSTMVKGNASDCGISDVSFGVESGTLYVSFSNFCRASLWEPHDHKYDLSVSGTTYKSVYGAEPGKHYSLGIYPGENVFLCATVTELNMTIGGGSTSKSKYYQQYHPHDWTQSYFDPCHYTFGTVRASIQAESSGRISIRIESDPLSSMSSKPQHTSGRVWVHRMYANNQEGGLAGDGYYSSGQSFLTAGFDRNSAFNQHFRIRIYSQGCPSYVNNHYKEAFFTVAGGPVYWEIINLTGFNEVNN